MLCTVTARSVARSIVSRARPTNRCIVTSTAPQNTTNKPGGPWADETNPDLGWEPFSSASTTPKPTLATVNPALIDVPPAQDPLLHYLTSKLLTHGHRARATKITSEILLHLHAFTRAPPLPILREAILRASPAVRTLNHKRGGKVVSKPVALGEKQRTKYAVDWILDFSKDKTGRSVAERVAREIIAVVQGTSKALDAKDKMHKFAMVNRGNSKTRV